MIKYAIFINVITSSLFIPAKRSVVLVLVAIFSAGGFNSSPNLKHNNYLRLLYRGRWLEIIFCAGLRDQFCWNKLIIYFFITFATKKWEKTIAFFKFPEKYIFVFMYFRKFYFTIPWERNTDFTLGNEMELNVGNFARERGWRKKQLKPFLHANN